MEFATIPVCFNHQRLQKNCVVTLGPDYHSGKRQIGCKFGLTCRVAQENVFVVWFDKLHAVLNSLQKRFVKDY
jgi:hypothetical protein